MVGCSAPNCHNSTKKGVRFFSFPTNKQRQKKWVINCRRDKWSPTSGSRLCEVHFEPSRFESNGQDGWRKLRPDAVPTIFHVPNPPRLLESRRRVLKRHASDDEIGLLKVQRVSCEHNYAKAVMGNTRIVENKANDLPSSSLTNDSIMISEKEQSEMEVVCCDWNDFNVSEHIEVVTSLPSPRKQVQIENLVQTLTRKNQQLNRQIRMLKKQLKASDEENEQLKKNLKKIFSSDQVLVLQSPTVCN